MGNWLREDLSDVAARVVWISRRGVASAVLALAVPAAVLAVFHHFGEPYAVRVKPPSFHEWYLGYLALVTIVYWYWVGWVILPVSSYEPVRRLPLAATKLGLSLSLTLFLALNMHLRVGLQTTSHLWAGLSAVGGSLAFLCLSLTLLFPDSRTQRFLRGRRVLSLREAQRQGGARASDGIPWGGTRVALEDATTHFAVVGAVGSGKTVTIHAIMKAVLPGLGGPRCQRALIYDTKGDTLPALAGMGLLDEGRVHVLNPFDARSCAWDMAADVRHRASAFELATILSPLEERSSSPYFASAARDILAEVICAFIRQAPGNWTLRDIVHAASSSKYLRRVLRQTPEGRDALAKHGGAAETWVNVQGSLGTKIEPLRVIAALWSRCPLSVSLTGWFRSHSILVLGSRSQYGATLAALNRVLFNRLSQMATDEEEDTDARTWFFIDEAKYAGKLEGITPLVDRGRSKGMCVVLGFQDVEGMRAVYSELEADSLIGQCEHKALLRVASPATAEWAASVVSDYEVFPWPLSRSAEGHVGWDIASGEQRMKQRAFLPVHFLTLRAPDKEFGPEGVYLHRRPEAYATRLRWTDLDLPPVDRSVPGFLPRPESDMDLEPWTEADLQRLGLAEKEDQEPADLPHVSKEAEPSETPEPGRTLRVVAEEAPPVHEAEPSKTPEPGRTLRVVAEEATPIREAAPDLGPKPRQKGLLDGVRHPRKF